MSGVRVPLRPSVAYARRARGAPKATTPPALRAREPEVARGCGAWLAREGCWLRERRARCSEPGRPAGVQMFNASEDLTLKARHSNALSLVGLTAALVASG